MPDNAVHSQLQEARDFANKLVELAQRHPMSASLVLHTEGEPAIELLAHTEKRLRSTYKMH